MWWSTRIWGTTMKCIASSGWISRSSSNFYQPQFIHSDNFFREFQCRRRVFAMSMSCLTAGTPVRGASMPNSSSSTDSSQYQVIWGKGHLMMKLDERLCCNCAYMHLFTHVAETIFHSSQTAGPCALDNFCSFLLNCWVLCWPRFLEISSCLVMYHFNSWALYWLPPPPFHQLYSLQGKETGWGQWLSRSEPAFLPTLAKSNLQF